MAASQITKVHKSFLPQKFPAIRYKIPASNISARHDIGILYRISAMYTVTYKLVCAACLSHWEFVPRFSSAMHSHLGHPARAAVGLPVGDDKSKYNVEVLDTV